MTDNLEAAAAHLNEVFMSWTSPVDGCDYPVTRASLMVRDLVDLQQVALLLTNSAKHTEMAKLRVAAIESKDKAALLDVVRATVKAAQEAQLKIDKELPQSQKSRYMITDLLKVLDSEAHGEYRTIKYAEGEATPESRLKSLLMAFDRITELVFVPGLF